ncbi:MAG TPA: hypothetical protein PLX97_06070 [Gemmatales bacterium]|nr:hypothetical protein [Gemmatales bacterium]
MFRIVLSLYLIVVAVLGPGLCCCAFGQLFVKKCEASNSDLAPASPCCHHHSKHHEVKPTSPGNQQEQPAPFCPCNQHQDIPVAPSLSSTTFAQFDFSQVWQIFFEQSLVPASIAFSASALNSTNLMHLVQLSAQDGLRAPFVLLC